MVLAMTSMRGSARRFLCLCLLALGVVGLSPASAGAAVTLGSAQIDQTLTDFGMGCSTPTCTFVQKRLPGLPVRAPFSGEVVTWRVVAANAGHDYQLAVMRKKRHSHGKFKNVGESSVFSAPGFGAFELPTSLPIRQGDYIGLKSDSVQGILNDQAKTWIFSPALEFPNTRKPSSSGSDEFQFNATVQR
jgi:hypothetical protein